MLHTPYDGSAKPFSIGLRPLDPAEWIEVDGHLKAYLHEKRCLYAEETRNVLVAEEGTEAAQAEVLAMLAEHLPKYFPGTYQVRDAAIEILDGAYTVNLADAAQTPIAIAGLLVQEDLVLMRPSPAGWRLVAASLCFPSAWSLREKFGRPLHAIHQPVPGFGEGTRNAGLIERMFDNLRVELPVMRWNWTLFGKTKLHHPASDGGQKRRFGDGLVAEHVTLRLERQTLRKLKHSGDILFTIRTHLNPIGVLEAHPDGPRLAQSIANQVAAFSADELAYKGLATERGALLERLNTLSPR
jgi:dimethylamine monooxygenase subunit A